MRKFDTPNPWCLVDNQLCETLASETGALLRRICSKNTVLGSISIVPQSGRTLRMHKEQDEAQMRKTFRGKISTPN